MKSIFISSTFRDMHFERDMLKKNVEPELNEFALRYGENILLKDLRWGINTQNMDAAEAEWKVLKTCLDEIDQSRPYMIVLLGDRYGWIPEKNQIENIIKGYRCFDEKDRFKSVTALEIEYGALKNPEQLKQTFFYFRKNEGDVPPEFIGTQEELKKIRELKNQIAKYADKSRIRNYTIRFENGEPKKEDRQIFMDMINQDIKSLMIKEWENELDKTPLQQEVKKHWNVTIQKAQQFQGREKVLNSCLKKLEQGDQVFVIQGASGIGKSSMIAKLAVERSGQQSMESLLYQNNETDERSETFVREFRKNQEVLPIFCGISNRITTAKDVMIHIIDYIGEKFSLPLWEEYRLKKSDSPENISKEDESVNSRSEEEDKDLIDLFQERISYYYQESEEGLLILVDGVDQLLPDEWRKNFSFIPNRLRIGQDENFVHRKLRNKPDVLIQMIISCTDTIEVPHDLSVFTLRGIEEGKRQVIAGILNYLRKELPDEVIGAVIERTSSQNPLYLSLVIQRLLMMDREDYKRIREQGDGISNITAYQKEIVRRLPDDLKGLTLELLNTAKHLDDLDGEFVQKAVEYIGLSRYGLREKDLEKIFESRNLSWKSADFALFFKYLRNFFVHRGDGRIDFSHRVIREGIESVIREGEKGHREIAHCLAGLSHDDRIKQDELLYHCASANDKSTYIKYIRSLGDMPSKKRMSKASKNLKEHCIRYGENRIVDMIRSLDKNDMSDIRAFAKLLKEYPKVVTAKEIELQKKLFVPMLDTLRNIEASDDDFVYITARLCYKLGRGYRQSARAEDYKKSELLYEEALSRLKFCDLHKKKALLSADIYDSLAELYKMMGKKEDLDKSEEFFIQALDLRKRLYEEEASDKNELKLATLYRSAGYFYKQLGGNENFAKAETLYRESLKLQEKRHKRKSDTESKLELTKTYNSMGALYRALKDEESCTKAETYYTMALDMRKEIFEHQRTLQNKEFLAHSYNNLAFFYRQTKMLSHFEEIERLYLASIQIKEELYEQLLTLESKQKLARGYHNLATLYSNRQDDSNRKKAEELYQKTILIREELYEHAQSISGAVALSNTYRLTGEYYEQEQEFFEAEKYYLKSFAIRKMLHESQQTGKSTERLYIVSENLRDLYRKMGEEHQSEAKRYREILDNLKKTV